MRKKNRSGKVKGSTPSILFIAMRRGEKKIPVCRATESTKKIMVGKEGFPKVQRKSREGPGRGKDYIGSTLPAQLKKEGKDRRKRKPLIHI